MVCLIFSDRTQYVKVKDTSSHSLRLTQGVPHASGGVQYWVRYCILYHATGDTHNSSGATPKALL